MARMGKHEENDPLLPKASTAGGQNSASHKLRFFVSLAIVLVVFKGSEAMSSTCYKQYLYYWSQQYVNGSDVDVVGDNTSQTSDSGSEKECDGDKKSNADEDKAQALASEWENYFLISSSVLVFISTSVYGTLSDYVGRKPFGCLALFGYATKCAVLTAVIYFDLHIAYFFIAVAVDGICGSVTTFSLYSYSSSADITTDIHTRVLGVAVIESLIGVGELTTSIVNGYYIKRYGYFYPMFTATCFIYFSLLLAVALVKETNTFDIKNSTHVNSAESKDSSKEPTPPCKTLLQNYIGFYVSKGQTGKRIFWLGLLIFFLVEFIIIGRSAVLTFYQLGRPFCWSSELIGWYNGIYMATCYALGLIALKPLLHCLSEYTAACVGMVSALAFNTILGLATSTLEMFLSK